MQKQTPKWLEHFITAFGPKGLVAMAWWLGAMHAKLIRELQQSFPFLHVDGGVAVGKSTLLATLWRLTGTPEAQFVSPRNCSRTALARSLFSPSGLPVVLEQSEGEPSFDWDILKPLFNNCTSASLSRGVDPATSGITYDSAVAVVGWVGEAAAFASRVIHLWLEPLCLTPDRVAARQALQGHCANEFAGSHQQRDLVTYYLGKTGAYIDGLRDDMGETLDARAALNHAQLLSLLDALADLYGLPDKAHVDARSEVWNMAWRRVDLPF